MASIVIIKNIMDVATCLFGLRDVFQKADKDRRDRIADYFREVSVCLAATYDSLASNRIPHGRCAELSSYADSLPGVVEGFIEETKARELSALLKQSYGVEGLWGLMNGNTANNPDIAIIAQASGIFLALSNSVRAGLKPAVAA